MNDEVVTALGPIRVRRYVWAIVACWTVAIGATAAWEVVDEFDQARALAENEAALRKMGVTDRKGRAASSGDASIQLPAEWPSPRAQIVRPIVGYTVMWLLGLIGVAAMGRHLRRQIHERDLAERKLQEANELLERRVADRTADLAQSNTRLHSEITDRRRAEQWLLESEQRFRGYFEQSLVGMAILAADRTWVEVNERLCRMLCYPERELICKAWNDLTHPDDLQAEEEQLKRVLDGVAKGYIIEKRFLRKDGKVVYATLAMQCMRKEDGSVDCLLALVQEINERS